MTLKVIPMCLATSCASTGPDKNGIMAFEAILYVHIVFFIEHLCIKDINVREDDEVHITHIFL